VPEISGGEKNGKMVRREKRAEKERKETDRLKTHKIRSFEVGVWAQGFRGRQ